MKPTIDRAIITVKQLKRESLHTEAFMIHHAQLTTLILLKEIGFNNISVGEEENAKRD